MKKKIISFLVSISIAMSLFPAGTFALTSGTCGDNLTWTFDDNGVLTISGIGEAGSLDGFNNDENVSKIVVNEGVRSINLWGLTNHLKEIEILSSDFNRFYGIMGTIESLEKITIAPSNKYMCTVEGVVYNKAMTEIILYPYGLENKEYMVPETIKEVSVDNAYLEEIVFHDEVTSISLDCPNLKELKIPDSVTYLYVANFLKFALYEDGLYYIGTINNPYKFLVGHDEDIRDVENAREIKISSRTEIISCGFCLPKLKELIVPDNVRVVQSLASDCENLEKITLGKGVEEIQSICYGYMPKLAEINIYAGAKYVSSHAISVWGGMSNVGDTEIGSGAVSLYPPIYDNLKPLDNDNYAESFYYLGNETNPYVTLFVMQNGSREYEKENLPLPDGLKTIAIDTVRYVEDNQTKYSDSFFSDLKTIQIPETLTYIAEGAFYGSENLTDVYYAGSKSEWEKIEICEGNEDLLNANIHFGEKDVQNVTVANIPAKTYGDADFTLSVTPDTTANLSSFTYASSNTDVAEIAADGTVTIKAAGETDITVTEPGNGEYAAFTNTQKLVVNKKAVTVTSVDLSAKTAVLEGILSADTAVAVNFDKLKLEIIDAVDETTSNVKVTGFELTGEKAENYTVATTELNSTIANDNVVTITATATSGTVTGAGSYIKGSSVTVTATPSSGYSFSGWYVDDASVSTSATYTFVADADIALTAKFAARSYGGGGGGAATLTYTVKFDTNGGNEISSQSVDQGELADEPETPKKDGYTFDGWYTDKNLTKAYDFSTKVTKNITLYAKWIENDAEEPEATDKPEEPADTQFNDVKADAWYADAVKFAVENKLMNGVSDTEFAPNATLTRAMLVTILYRNDGEPAVDTEVAFEDVASGSYYEKAVEWAKANGIVDGVSDNVFAPDANITREQIAAIMHRYASYKGYDVNKSAGISERDDYSEISDYAVSAMEYMVASGLMNGKTNTTLDPQDNATRAEIATILQRFITANN